MYLAEKNKSIETEEKSTLKEPKTKVAEVVNSEDPDGTAHNKPSIIGSTVFALCL